MQIALTGATGFVGSYLANVFLEKNWRVTPIGRDDLALSSKDLAKKIDGSEVIVNLAGANIVKRWTEEYKQELYNSRIGTTIKLVEAMGQMLRKPKIFISASAVGIYDDKGRYGESDYNFANNYLAKIVKDWEKTALKAREINIRTIVFRFGVVLGKGGLLAKMLPSFKLGMGGKIGSGRQSFSWVHIEDLSRAYMFAVEHEELEGIYNLVSPNAVTNKVLTKTLAKILHRPALFPIPIWLLWLIFGEGVAAISSGQNVIPERLLKAGFRFRFETIEHALRDVVSSFLLD
ncbi:MAG: TIGR01777 family oxidoreductase [Proteobacteria bacterium]|nr:TIGR01777 family oxidoreductase [Pseudomonadota bacterium]MCG2830255.1 TIGR01777 family oxidoreductase [Desulfobacteraceae bacterium]